ncbi:MAG TPA: cupin domain-containing protein, partial [Cyanobium sp.]|nr:cupin domain-containing protein [Cyanobium sp.]
GRTIFTAALMGGVLLGGMVADGGRLHAQQVIGGPGGGDVLRIRPETGSDKQQKAGEFVGIFGSNSGARGLSLRRLVIPPGGRAKAHRHVGHESAVYLIQGTVETRYGPRLEHKVVSRAGDFIFIPADVVHQPINLSTTEAAIAIEARTDPDELGRVEFLDRQP